MKAIDLIRGLLLVLLAQGLPAASGVVLGAEPLREAVEVVVTGRQPGPPLWRVYNGENVLHILPIVSVVPRNMSWEDDRLRAVIRAADEALGSPEVKMDVSRLVLLNPVNWFRGYRLMKRITRNADEQTLQEVLPVDLWQRYARLKAEYFPREDDIDALRPVLAGGRVRWSTLSGAGLRSGEEVTKHVERLLRRERGLTYTIVEIEERLEGGYGVLSRRAEDWVNSLSLASEIACFESQVGMLERHLDDMKAVANAWATGSARDLEDFSVVSSLEDPCATLLLESSEGELMRRLLRESQERWLMEADRALRNNRSTFAVLALSDIIGQQSLVDQLVARGYTLHVPN